MALVNRLRIFGPKRRVLKLRYETNDNSVEVDDSEDDVRNYNFPSSSTASSSSVVETDISCNVVDYLHRREHGTNSVRPVTFDANYGTRYLLEHGLFRESEVSVQSYNKIFCSKWLSDRHILFGTKCNKLVVLDLLTKEFIRIPSLESSRHSEPPDVPCGIHSIQINPSRTLLVTGASNSNDVAVYRLPTLDPVCVGEGAHRDWIFDAIWLDDQFFITGSRDTTVALWQVRDSGTSNIDDGPNHSIMSPLLVRKCEKAQKVRALSFNHKYQEFVALSLDACLHIWDINCFKQKFSRKLPQCSENVCLAMREDCSMYAVGSKSYLTLHDSRTLCAVDKIPTKTPACSIRSASFNDNLITLGTGMGVIMFYDCRAGKYLERKPDPSLESNSFRSQSNLPYRDSYRPPVTLQANRGWVCPDDVFHEVFQGIDYSPAIYTHCYDPSGTKLFTAGGPLPANLHGSYAGLWQ